MQHLILKAATTATDQGMFEAVISAGTVDRERDIVDPDGMVAALRKWVETGKKIPLAWNHSGAPDEQIGYIDPASAKNVAGEVVVSGWIDQSIPVGRDAWRLVKMGTLGFSFGYLIPDGGAVKRAGGGQHINELDVFEVTATPTPMHNGTRVLGYKAVMGDPAIRILNSMLGQAQEFIDGESDQEDIDAMNDILEALRGLLDEENTEGAEPQESSLPKSVKDREAQMAERLMGDTQKSVDATGKAPSARSVDPLKARARDAIREIRTGGLQELAPRKAVEEQPKPGPVMEPDGLREYSRRLMKQVLIGTIGTTEEP